MADARSFPPSARLHSPADFAGLRRCRQPLRGRFFIVRHVAGSHDQARLGLAVSRKTSRRAVVRNRIKRHVRESFRAIRHELPPRDILVIALPPAAAGTGPELREELDRHWQRLAQLSPVATA